MLGNIISWIVFGFIAGLLARMIMPGKDPGGFIITTLLGIAGAFVGGFVARYLNLGGASQGFRRRRFSNAAWHSRSWRNNHSCNTPFLVKQIN